MGFRERFASSLACLLARSVELSIHLNIIKFCPFFLIRHLDGSRFKCAPVCLCLCLCKCVCVCECVSVFVFLIYYYLLLFSVIVAIFHLCCVCYVCARAKKGFHFISVAGSLKGFSCDLFMLACICSALHLPVAHFHRSFLLRFSFGGFFIIYVALSLFTSLHFCSKAIRIFFCCFSFCAHFSYITLPVECYLFHFLCCF